jgi:uncharacterized protein (DUF433 family)
MVLEDYFDFLSHDDIRIRGTRVGIETVLYDFIHRSRSPEEIAASYPSVTLEQVYATIVYYLHHREQVTAYLEEWLTWGKQERQRQALDASLAPVRLRLQKATRAGVEAA